MSAVERGRAAAPPWRKGPPRIQHSRHVRRPLAPLGRPMGTRLPGGSCSTRHQRGEPIYLSFVSKAVLWDRRLCHNPPRDRPPDCPSLCPRFLSHMKVHPEEPRPPCIQASKPRPPPLFQGKMSDALTLAAPKMQTLQGLVDFKPENRRKKRVTPERRPVLLPCLPVPSTPLSSTLNSTPPLRNTPLPDPEGQQDRVNGGGGSPGNARPPVEENNKVQIKEPPPDDVSLTGDAGLPLRSVGPACSPSPPSVLSSGSPSGSGGPPSSGWLRGKSADGSERSTFSPLQPCPLMGSPLVPRPPPGSASANIPPANSGHLTPFPVFPPSSEPFGPGSPENLPAEASAGPVSGPFSDSDPCLATLAFPSTTWSSCPSPERTTPRSGSGAGLSPSASAAGPDPHRWPLLPPISPVKGCGASASSRSSELSCSRSHMFDELEAIAPPSPSCRSSDSPRSASAHTAAPRDVFHPAELSPGLAALTVGCRSGHLSSISRVQLLLLDRAEPADEELSPLQDCFGLGPRDEAAPTFSGVRRASTAGSLSESCDPPGRVLENKSDQSGSPSSWITRQSPSCDTFRSAACSPCGSGPGSSTDEEGVNYPGGKEEAELCAEGRGAGGDGMEEGKRKALNLLSKLRDDAPCVTDSSKGLSNFEDFDFLAKYCIFSQETLAEYRKAFEEADSDGDGYISCLQALLALKHIVPAELLSDEEEIYIYRILEMVDFRVTDGLVDLRLFAVISSLAQKIASMDEFMRSLIGSMDFRSLEARLFKVKQLFLFLLDEQRGDAAAHPGVIGPEQLLLELKAGGIPLEPEPAVLRKLQHIPALDLLDFLAHLPLFLLIHNSVVSNPLNDL